MMHVIQNDDTYFFSSVLKLNDFYENVLPIPLVKVNSLYLNYSKIKSKKYLINFQ